MTSCLSWRHRGGRLLGAAGLALLLAACGGGSGDTAAPAGASSDPIDFEGDTRPIDGPLANLGGPYDVGFDEYSERIFRDGFETPG